MIKTQYEQRVCLGPFQKKMKLFLNKCFLFQIVDYLLKYGQTKLAFINAKMKIMSKNAEGQKVKMNLSIDKEFFDLLRQKADDDYMKVSTWTMQFLKRTW